MTLLLVLAGCNENSFARAHTSDFFLQAPSNLVDILWVVDNSISMENEQKAVATGFQDFVNQLVETDIDFHLGLITMDVSAENTSAGALLGNPPVLTPTTANYVQLFQQRVLVGTDGDDQERGLQAALTALTPPMTNTRNVGFLRDEAMLSIIMVSDENDCSDFGALGPDSSGEDCYQQYEELVSVADLVRDFRDLKEDASRVVLSGIIGPDAVENCVDTVPGKRYMTAIGMLGGVTGNICETNYSEVMDALGAITTGILTTFALGHVPDVETIEVTVFLAGTGEWTVPQGEVDGWTYSDDPTAPALTFHGTGVPPRGAEITVEYVVLSEIQEPETGG